MAYTVEPITEKTVAKERVIDPRSKKTSPKPTAYSWWLAQNEKDLCAQLLSTTEYLKQTNKERIKQASIFTRLYCGKPLYNFLASTSKMDSSNQLPIGRPTANVVYSCTDTLVSRISQDRPQPTFLTNAGNHLQRKLSKDANRFVQGEFYRTKTYDLAALMNRDACVLGTGLIKVLDRNDKVHAERTLETELLVDYNDAYYGDPKQLIQLKLVDRGSFMSLFPDKAHLLINAQSGNADNTPRSTQTVSDEIILVEAWRLNSFEGSNDGRHVLACSQGVLDDHVYDKTRFPFAREVYNPVMVGWFGQSLTEILMPTQMELYRLLIVASQSIELMGVPRVLIEEMSKILETSFNNRIGSMIKYRNTPPQFVNAESNPPEIYQFIQWLIANAYQISGISAMSAQGTKPAGLNSGAAIRSFDDIQNDRFAAFAKRHQNTFPDLAYLMIDTAKDIVDRTGEYSTIYPGKEGTERIDFKAIGVLDDTYIIQCFEQSSLPKDPAGRQAKLSEMLAAQEITNQEFRRLSSFPDLEQSDQLAAALEERILSDLDNIIAKGRKGYKEPDPFILDPSDLATTLTVNYINKYSVTDIEENKMDCLRDYFAQVQDLKQQAAPPPEQVPQEEPSSIPVAQPQLSIAPTSNVAV